jgi:hypothetical protein
MLILALGSAKWAWAKPPPTTTNWWQPGLSGGFVNLFAIYLNTPHTTKYTTAFLEQVPPVKNVTV